MSSRITEKGFNKYNLCHLERVINSTIKRHPELFTIQHYLAKPYKHVKANKYFYLR